MKYDFEPINGHNGDPDARQRERRRPEPDGELEVV